MHATRSSHYIVLDVIALIQSGEEYNCGAFCNAISAVSLHILLGSSALCS